jgi:hypothetical protein
MDAAGVIIGGILAHVFPTAPARDVELRQKALLHQRVEKVP